MVTALSTIMDRLTVLEVEMVNLRESYFAVNKKYNDTLSGLSSITLNASNAAQLSAKAAKLARKAASDSAKAAKHAASEFVAAAAEKAAEAAEHAAESALASASAASVAASAAAEAVVHHSSDIGLKASAAAAKATNVAAAAAFEAVQMSNLAKTAFAHSKQGKPSLKQGSPASVTPQKKTKN
jgi:hypothetical protein